MQAAGLGLLGLVPPSAVRAHFKCIRSHVAQPQPQPCGAQLTARLCAAPSVPCMAARRRQSVCAAAAEPSATETALVDRPKVVTEQWQKILDIQKAGEVVTSTITKVNRGGVVIDVLGIAGFIPFSRMDPARFSGANAASSQDMADVSVDSLQRESMAGQSIKAKIIQVNIPERLLVLSERAAYMVDLSKTLKQGDVVDGIVQKLTDYGVFVSVRGPDGSLHGTDALIHKSELSWDRVMRPEQVVRPGDELRCKVTSVDAAKARVNLSLKRMQSDPLKETLDGVLPVVEEGAEALGTVPINVPQSIEEVASELGKEEGITGITMGRQVEERRTVAQDLEIYISRKKVEDGYALVARAGRVVQEVVVKTDLDPAGLKAAMQRALKRLV